MPRVKAAGSDKPKGRTTSYAFFVQTCRDEHKKLHPDENVQFAEFSRQCSERWKTMSDKEKNKFHEMADNDKVRHDKEMANWTPPQVRPKDVARDVLAAPRKRRTPTSQNGPFPPSSIMPMLNVQRSVQQTQTSVLVR